ncbi:MAG: hypothetical protein COW71_13335 [Ignavibacteriales bacterium CG18_big_fil_WC_8_21_14_2_50_31_20]|nr:MAG: hypothetical protein COW71_13335 [Ignavibacteriales bacterium CG18_big_fil_WC_8_21_14_2_50_31_20]
MKKGIFLIFLFINFYVSAQTNYLSFSEVMFYPIETNGEFIELFNLSTDSSVNLSNYQIVYATSTADKIVEFNNGTILPPNNYAAIFENDYDFVNGLYMNLVTDSTLILQIDNGKFGSSGMANTSDRSIYLLNEIGDTIDTYTYSANNSAGYSDEKILANGNNSLDNWSNSNQRNGTPGFKNSVSSKNYDLSISHLTILPKNIYENNEVEFLLGVKNNGLNDASSFLVKLYLDFNRDSLAQSDEFIINNIEPIILSNDSLEFESSIFATTTGMFNVFAEIEFIVDENISDNYFSTEINILPKPNEYNDIVINEIMYKPIGDEPEWIELFNGTDKGIDLINWRIADRTSATIISDSSFYIEPLEYLVITDDSLITEFYVIPSKIKVINLPSLNNTDDDIQLLNPQTSIIDSVAYKSTWGGNNGKSLERIAAQQNSNDFNNWESSISKYFATPGTLNSVTQRENDLAISLLNITPLNPIVGEIVSLSFLVKNVGLSSISNFSIDIYHDINLDSIAQSHEKLTNIAGEFIVSGDSIIYKEILNDFNPGKNNYIVNIDLDIDNNIENNSSNISFYGNQINEIRNDIVINEIMHSPILPEPEWIEIFNRSEKTITLKNYKIADLSDTITICGDEIFLAPNEYFIFADDSSFIDVYPNVKSFVISNLPNLNNSGDRIVLLDSLNRIIDSLHYYSAWGGLSGKSLERYSDDRSSTDSSNWSSANLIYGGTPNMINSISIKNYDVSLINIFFNPTKPKYGDNVSLEILVKNTGKESLEFKLVWLEDIYGDSTNIIVVESSPSIFLRANDSVFYKFSSQILDIKQTHNYIVKAIAENDENVLNNFINTSISPGFNFSSIIVNEIMYSPINGEPEWIEFLNASSDTINIHNFSISDVLTTPKSTTIEYNHFISPNEYFVVSKDSIILDYHTSIQSTLLFTNFANLNNDIDGIVLKDSFGEVIDSIKYRSLWGGTAGKSLERIISTKNSNDSTNWKSSTDIELSTPGRKNTATPFNFDLQISDLNLVPEFPIRDENVLIKYSIKNIGLSKADNFSVKIKFTVGNSQSILEESNFSNLQSGDSISVISNNSFVINDSVLVKAQVNYQIDEDTLNNKMQKTFFSGAKRNSVLINEFMANPNSDETEWVEIYNNTESTIDISNWYISDLYITPKLSQISTNPLFIKSNDFLIITNDTSKIFPSNIPIVESKFGTLGNIEDGIIIYDFNHNIIDSLKYDKDWQIEKGRSFERFSLKESAADISNWLPSLSISGSSPGLNNSILNTIQAEPNSVIINEIMYDPEFGNSEFIEFYNTTGEAINIGGWKLVVNEIDYLEISSTFLSLKSMEYFVVSSDSSIFLSYSDLNKSNIKILKDASLSLSNAGESIIVIDHWGNLIDSLFYNPKLHNKNIAVTKNKSLERISFNIGSNEQTNWSTSVNKDGATPGKVNSIFAENTDTEKGISFSPNPFSPDNDGFEDFTIINYSLPFTTAQIRIKLFDDHGRLVKTILNNKSVAQSGSIIFDGLNDNGNPLRIGMYIVYVEAIDNNSGKAISYKDVIVVARKL